MMNYVDTWYLSQKTTTSSTTMRTSIGVAALLLSALATLSSSYSFVAPSALQRPSAAAAVPRSRLQHRSGRTAVSMGNNAAFGLFSPAVVAAKAVLGEKTLNKLRGKGITLHSQVRLPATMRLWAGS